MTTQEFVKQESEARYDNRFIVFNPDEQDEINKGMFIDGYANGLTKGLEIAIAFRDWTDAWKVDYREQTTHTTSELLAIFLTEKYWK